jgi:hypothetical protein
LTGVALPEALTGIALPEALTGVALARALDDFAADDEPAFLAVAVFAEALFAVDTFGCAATRFVEMLAPVDLRAGTVPFAGTGFLAAAEDAAGALLAAAFVVVLLAPALAAEVIRTPVFSLFVAVCTGIDFFGAFRTAPARSAMAIPHTCKTGARRGAAHSEGGKNTEPTVFRQTCHTWAPQLGGLPIYSRSIWTRVGSRLSLSGFAILTKPTCQPTAPAYRA